MAWDVGEEPYNSYWHRDYETSDLSISGHYSFCTAMESTEASGRLKMVDFAYGSNTHWSNLSGVLNVLNGNNYNDYTSECWTTPNMVA